MEGIKKRGRMKGRKKDREMIGKGKKKNVENAL